MGMQKKKKVVKAKAKAAKTTKSKNAKAKPVAKKAVKTPVTAKKASKPAPSKQKAATPKVKVTAEKVKPVAKRESVLQASKLDLKNLSPEAQEQYKRWLKLQRQLAEEKTLDYKMTEDFELKAPISHRVHGWGVVVQKRDNYIDVLFEVGLKTLIVNYKP